MQDGLATTRADVRFRDEYHFFKYPQYMLTMAISKYIDMTL